MIKRFVLIIFSVYILLLVGLYFFQERIIFRPQKLTKNFTYSFDNDFEEVWLKSEGKACINALHFKVKNPKGIVLYFHGNKDNLQRWGNIASWFTKFNYDVFIMDYRGYGKSKGKRNEKNLYKDAQQCYTYCKQFFNEENIIVYGRSLGCTFATSVASKNKPKQLILEAPFYNLNETAKFHYIYVPQFLLNYKFSTHKSITKINCPITFFHGTNDRVISYSSGKRLFDAVVIKQKEFVAIENGTHHNLTESEAYKKKIKALLAN